jgi:double-stranded RNA-binding protein Staufen
LFIFRYFYPFPVPPLLYQVELSVGGQQFNGKGKTRQAAKHDAAAKALRILQSEPPPERLEVRGQPRGREKQRLQSLFLRRFTDGCP